MNAQIVLAMVLCVAPGWAQNSEAERSMIGRYLDARWVQEAALRSVQAQVSIEARLRKPARQGSLRLIRSTSATGRITHLVTKHSGDRTVVREVIGRYLAAETEARDSRDLELTPVNYKFRLMATLDSGNQVTYVFRVTPRKRKIGLFKGELWVDRNTGMPLRESGQFVRSPSVFIRKIRFVRDYEIRDGIAIPRRIVTRIDARPAGRADLDVQFGAFHRLGDCVSERIDRREGTP